MSTETELAKDKSRSSHAGAGGADVDVSHSSDVAHKTSKAGLQKAESAAKLQSASQHERSEQRDSSKLSNVEGYEGAILVAAKLVMDHCARIEQQRHNRDSLAGSEPLRQLFHEGTALIDSQVADLYLNVGSAITAGMDVQPLRQAMSMFERACTYFQHLAIGEGAEIAGPNTGLTRGAQLRMKSLFDRVGIAAEGGGNHAVPTQMSALRGAGLSTVTNHAIGAMATAASEAVRLARMSVRGVANETRIHDFKRASANLRELAALVETVDDKAKRQHHAALHAVALDARHLFAEERAHPLEADRDENRAKAEQHEFSSIVASGNMTEPSIGKLERAAK